MILNWEYAGFFGLGDSRTLAILPILKISKNLSSNPDGQDESRMFRITSVLSWSFDPTLRRGNRGRHPGDRGGDRVGMKSRTEGIDTAFHHIRIPPST
jgi:hypothetical protein